MGIFDWFRDSNQLIFGSFSGLITFLVLSFSLYTLADRKRDEYPWFAFVPILNLLLICKLAKVNPLWLVTFLLWWPIGTVVAVVILMKLARTFGRSPFYGIFLAIPVVQLFAWPIMAFRTPREA